jgi:hypothetical protein
VLDRLTPDNWIAGQHGAKIQWLFAVPTLKQQIPMRKVILTKVIAEIFIEQPITRLILH